MENCCLSIETMADYVLGALTEEQAAVVEIHIANCRTCAEGVCICFQTNNTWERFESAALGAG